MITIGRFELFSVVTGRFRLDGGAMFGVVPRVVWERKSRPDDQNRIQLATRTLVGIDRAAGRVVLVDTGAGHKWPPEEGARFAIEPDPAALANALVDRGLGEQDVTDVVITHLHFDHNGGLTEWADTPGGATRLRFANARHWIHARHWRHATHPTDRDRASFLERDLASLREPGVLTIVEGDNPPPPFDGVRWHLSHGHTPYQLLPVFEGDPSDLMFVGDMIPTANHLPAPWIMAYDVEPLVTLEEKRAVFELCADQGLQLAFPHDPNHGGVTIDLGSGRPAIKAALAL